MVSSESNRREDDRDYYYCEGLVGSHLNPALSTMTIDSFFFFFFSLSPWFWFWYIWIPLVWLILFIFCFNTLYNTRALWPFVEVVSTTKRDGFNVMYTIYYN